MNKYAQILERNNPFLKVTTGSIRKLNHEKKIIKKVIPILILCFLMAGCATGNDNNYDLGKAAMSNQEWGSAIEYFTGMDYKDSADLLMECKYNLGKEALEDEDWDSAISWFSENEYSNSNELLLYAEREKLMHENADAEFLSDIEDVIKNSQRMTHYGESREAIVNAEMMLLNKYRTRTFYDTELKKLFTEYYKGLKIQYDALECRHSEQQVMWQEGLVTRYEALDKLYTQYNIFCDDIEFYSEYIAQLPTQTEYLKKLQAINSDFSKQYESIEFLNYVNQNTQSFDYGNKTRYDFDLVLYINYYDADHVHIYNEVMARYNNIMSGETYEMAFYWPQDATSCNISWEITVH